MSKTLVDVDEELLAQARALLGEGTTKKDGVNGALREFVRLGAIRNWLKAVQGDGLEQPDSLVLVDDPAG